MKKISSYITIIALIATIFPFSAVKSNAAPDVPTNITASPDDGLAYLSWTAPVQGGNDPVTDYSIQYRIDGSGAWTDFTHTAQTTTTTTISGLTDGTLYDFQVAAINDIGTGAYTSTAYTMPLAQVYSNNFESYTVGQDVSNQNDFGSLYSDTILNIQTGDGGQVLSHSNLGNTNKISYTILKEYNQSNTRLRTDFQFAGNNTQGVLLRKPNIYGQNQGYWIFYVGGRFYLKDAATGPSGTTLALMGVSLTMGNWYTLDASVINDASGNPVITASVYPQNTQPPQTPGISFVDTSKLYPGAGYEGLSGTNSSPYVYDNVIQYGTPSSVNDIPSAPVINGIYPNNGRVMLIWQTQNVPADKPVIGYVLQYRQSGTSQWTTYSSNPRATISALVTGLTNGTSYDFQVALVNTAGQSSFSQTASATPATGLFYGQEPANTTGNDEFNGPFPSWVNIKTAYGAVGDGVADDTAAFNNAIAALSQDYYGSQDNNLKPGIIYVPAGTYNITSTVNISKPNISIIGADPTTTKFIWGGSNGGQMFHVQGFAIQMNRLTFDGQNSANTILNLGPDNGIGYTGNGIYTDDIFQNAALGIVSRDPADNSTPGCCSAEINIQRDVFQNLTSGAISLYGYNDLDWWIRDSTFLNNNIGVTDAINNGAGGFHVYDSLFEHSTDSDIKIGNAGSFSMIGNTSYQSGHFLSTVVYVNIISLQNNTILDPTGTAIITGGPGQLLLLHNVIRGTAPLVTTSLNAVDNTVNDQSQVTSIGNVFTVVNPYYLGFSLSASGAQGTLNANTAGLDSIDDQVVDPSTVSSTLPTMPAFLPNAHRVVYNIVQGSTETQIQAAINRAFNEQNGNKAIVHLSAGVYPITTPLIIPANSDVQLIGDNQRTTLSATGTGLTQPVITIAAPSHAVLRGLYITGGSVGVQIQTKDLVGDHISGMSDVITNSTSNSLLVNGTDNTVVSLNNFIHALSGPDSVMVNGGPLSIAGQNTPGFVGIYAGGGANSTNTFSVDKNGKLLVQDSWYEGGNQGLVDLIGKSGKFTFDGGNLSENEQNHQGNNSLYQGIDMSGFTGSATIIGASIGRAYPLISGTGASKFLLLNSGTGQIPGAKVPFIVNTNPNSQSALLDTFDYNNGTFTHPDELINVPSKMQFVHDQLAQLAAETNPGFASLPPNNEDVRMYQVFVNGAGIGIDIESIAPAPTVPGSTPPPSGGDGNGQPPVPTTPSGGTLSGIVPNTIVVDKGITYWISNDLIKVPVTSNTVLKSLGYNAFHAISRDTSSLPLAKTYTLNNPLMAHPWGSWLNNKGSIYYATSAGMIPVPSQLIFTSNGGSTDQLLTMNAADAQILATQRLSPMIISDPRVTAKNTGASAIVPNAIVLDGGKSYWISNDLIKVPFLSNTVLQALGYTKFRTVTRDTTSLPIAKTYALNDPLMAHPWGSWLTNNGTIYYSTSNGMIPVPTNAIFIANGGSADQLIAMNFADTAILNAHHLAQMIVADARLR